MSKVLLGVIGALLIAGLFLWTQVDSLKTSLATSNANYTLSETVNNDLNDTIDGMNKDRLRQEEIAKARAKRNAVKVAKLIQANRRLSDAANNDQALQDHLNSPVHPAIVEFLRGTAGLGENENHQAETASRIY